MLQNTTRTRSAALLSAPSSKSKVDNILVKDTDLCINIVCQIVCQKTIRLNSTKSSSVRTTDIFLHPMFFSRTTREHPLGCPREQISKYLSSVK